MIRPLPNWSVNLSRYAYNDIESATAIEQTARLYKVIQDLINEWNTYESTLNTEFSSFKEDMEQDQCCFKTNIEKLIHDYIHQIDMMINNQNLEIKNAVDFMKDNLGDSIQALITEMKESGELDEVILTAFENINSRVEILEKTDYELVYEPGTENLILQKVVRGE